MQGRGKVSGADRTKYFDASDLNKDKRLSREETKAHEEMIRHFKKKLTANPDKPKDEDYK